MITLRTKDKLGFIDSTFEMPLAGSQNLEKWKKVDNMVTTWILNSISKELIIAFTYALSSQILLEEVFGKIWTEPL